MSYAQIVNNAIVAQFSGLPSSFGNISGFNTLSDAEAAAYGFLPVTEVASPTHSKFYNMTEELVQGVPTQVWTEKPLRDAQATLLAELEAQRQQAETAGITVNGLAVATDPDTLNLLTRARAALAAGVTHFPYLFASGWQALDATTADAMLLAVGQHIQACASNHQTLWTAINATTDLDGLAAIDLTKNWPQ